MSLQPLELVEPCRPTTGQPLPLILALPIITGLSATLWLLIGRLAKMLLGL